MEWHPIQRSTESYFSEAATKKMLEECYKKGDIKGLHDAAVLLNTLLHQQRTVTRWLAGEAARNLGRPEAEANIVQKALIDPGRINPKSS